MNRPALIFAPIAATLIVVFAFTAWRSAELVERSEAGRLTAELATSGQGWATVEADGMTLRATGEAPDAEALSAASALVEARRWGSADFALKPTPVAVSTPEFALSFHRDGATVKVTGATPDAATRRLIAGLSDIGEIGDISETYDVEAPKGWSEALIYALGALRQMPQTRITVRPGAVEIESSVESEEIRETVTAALRQTKPEGCKLTLKIIAPPPALSPYRFVIDKSGADTRIFACAAETEAQRAEIVKGVTDALGFAPECQIALGAPSADWAAAVLAGVRAVASLPSARFELSDSEAQLFAAQPTNHEAFGVALRDLTLALSSSYSLLSAPPPLPTREFAAPGQPETPATKRWFKAIATPDGALTLSGEAPDDATLAAILTYAQSLKGASAVKGQMSIAIDLAPEGWRRSALAGLEALALLDSGEAIYDGDTLRVIGQTESPEKIAAVTAALAPKIALGLKAETEIRVDQTSLAARLPLSPAQCVANLSGAVAREPISFAPSSADIGEESKPVLDALAATLKRCGDLRIEIAGHTDAQGREFTNLALSDTRADAVMDALLDRGVSLEKLVARGYGESIPIADNGSEEGRARNRRIEFTLAEDAQ